MTVRYSRELYPRDVIIKTAYMFTDKYYVHLDIVGDNYELSINPKKSEYDEDLEEKLGNEIISQLTRYIVSAKTASIRKLLMGRAFSSALIEDNEISEEYEPGYISSAESILKDWFDNNE